MESKTELEKVKKITYINKVKRKIQELYQTSDDSGVPSKLDSTLTPKLLTYSRKYKWKRRAPMVCVEVMDGASIYSPSKVGNWQLFPVASVASR